MSSYRVLHVGQPVVLLLHLFQQLGARAARAGPVVLLVQRGVEHLCMHIHRLVILLREASQLAGSENTTAASRSTRS